MRIYLWSDLRITGLGLAETNLQDTDSTCEIGETGHGRIRKNYPTW